ncbi:hypothetical protein [Nocardia alba]|nr:hypothetical protein [Nocardia alba]
MPVTAVRWREGAMGRVIFGPMWIILAISVVSSVAIAILFATGFPKD